MEINNNKTDSIRELGKVRIKQLIEKLKLLTNIDWDTEEDFKANYNKRSKSVLNTTQHIILRFSNKQVDPFQYFSCSRWKEFAPILLPIMDAAAKPFGYIKGVYTRVMLAKLSPNCFIAPHKDGDKTGSIPHKIHIPLEINEGVFFYVDGIKYQLKEGEAYEVNNAAMHSVANSGDTDRIHLIFEYLDYNAQSRVIQNEIDKQ